MDVFELFTYQKPTPTLPTRHLFLPPGGPTTMKRSRTKKNEEEERMKNADLIIFYIFCYLLKNQKFQKNQKLFENPKILVIY